MPQREQLNLRLPPDWFELLALAAWFENTTLMDYVRGMLEERVSVLRSDPDLQATIKRKAERDGVKTGKVTRLHDRREDREG